MNDNLRLLHIWLLHIWLLHVWLLDIHRLELQHRRVCGLVSDCASQIVLLRDNKDGLLVSRHIASGRVCSHLCGRMQAVLRLCG